MRGGIKVASINDELSYSAIIDMHKHGKLNFDILSEEEICSLLDNAIEQFENENSDESESLINSCLKALDRFPKYAYQLDDEKILSNVLISHDTDKNCKTKSSRHSKKVRTLASIAATIAIFFSLSIAVAYANGYNFFDVIFNRKSETLEVDITTSSDSKETPLTDNQEEFIGEKEYTDFNLFIAENPKAKVPTYVPDGMEFAYGQAVVEDNHATFNLTFVDKHSDESLSIFIENCSEGYQGGSRTLLEIDNELSEQYVVNGVTHYIESNYTFYTALWIDGKSNYLIGGNIPLKEIKKIIDSYYGGK